MSYKHFRLVAAPTIFVVALSSLLSCAGDPRKQVLDSLCSFERDRPSTLTSYVNNAGGIVYGDVVSVADLSPKAVYASMAGTTKSSVLSRTHREVVPVCGPAGCYQTTIRVAEEEDVRGVFGVARATTKDDAESMALDNCEKEAEKFADENNVNSSRIDCETIRTTECF